MPSRLNSIDRYLNWIVTSLYSEHKIDVIRIWFLSYDRKALACKKFLYNGKIVTNIPKSRLLLERHPCVSRVLEILTAQVHSYKMCKEACDPKKCYEYLDKENVNEWIEAPLVDTITREPIGIICLIDTKRCRPISQRLITRIRNAVNTYSHELTNIASKQRYHDIANNTEQLYAFDQELLKSLSELRPNTPWTLLSAVKKAIVLIRKTTNAQIVQLFKFKEQKLITECYSSEISSEKLIFDMNNKDHRSIPFVNYIANREEIQYVEKIKDPQIINVIKSFPLNDSEINYILDITSWSINFIWVDKQIKYYLLVASKDFDFFFETNMISIRNFVSKLGLIATTEHSISLLKNQIKEDNTKLQQHRDIIERGMRIILKSDMARLVLHDFSTYVDSAALAVEEIIEDFEKTSYFKKKDKIDENIKSLKNSISDMTDMLHNYASSKINSSEKQNIQVVDLLNEACAFCEARANRRGINIYKRFEDSSSVVFCSRIDLNIVFINIIQNAIDAIIENRLDKKRKISIRGMCENNLYKIKVSDTGIGVKDNIKAKIFEPDFTTKWKTGGTGIGLFSANRVVTELGGYITLKSSSINKGSTFEIAIPIHHCPK